MPDQFNIPDAVALAQLVDAAAQNQLYGSFSERNPTLGKMRTCPYCEQRKRVGDPTPCCHVAYVAGTQNDKIHFKGRKNPRLSRNKPPLLEIHQHLLEMERSPGYKEIEGISGIVEAAVKRKRKAKSAKRTKQQKISRKRNRK